MAKKKAQRFCDLPEKFSNPKTARIAVLPVPYDRTSTWKKGADKGPDAIIAASSQLEVYDIPTDSEVFRHGIETLDPIRHTGTPEALSRKVESAVKRIIESSRFPVLLGGEHSISIGAFRAAATLYDNLSILQIDAHADTREEYEGSKFNHACVMARARELCPITQVGIRAIDSEEVDGLEKSRVFFAHNILKKDDDKWMDRVVNQQSKDVYVTIDLDAFDPAVVPATGTPEPGGLSWQQVTTLLDLLSRKRRVVGFDVVELCPHSAHWASDFLAAKLVYRFLSMIFARH